MGYSAADPGSASTEETGAPEWKGLQMRSAFARSRVYDMMAVSKQRGSVGQAPAKYDLPVIYRSEGTNYAAFRSEESMGWM